jgi:hypothetical protein
MLARHEEEAGPRQHNAAGDDLRSLRVERRGKADAASIMTVSGALTPFFNDRPEGG